MLNNLLQITCCWGIFYALYWVFFRKETFFRLNRFYLLGTLLLGLIIPQLDFAFFNENSPLANANYLQTVTVGVENLAAAIVITPENSGNGFQWNWQLILKGIYSIGVAFFSIKFICGLWKIVDLFKNSNKTQYLDYQLIENKNIKIPFSFFNLLFWNKDLEKTDPDYQKILQHERAHIRQWHSVDVLILEIMTILFWWNPLVWFYKKSLRTVHEYLADDAVLQTTQKKQYGQLLIRQSHSGMQVALVNNFIQSQLKNRIMMMMKSKSQSQQLWKYLLFLPVFGLLFMTFSCENATAQSEEKTAEANLSGPDDEIYKVVEEMPRFAGTVTDGLETEEEKQNASNQLLLNHIYTNVTYPKNAREQGIQGVTVVRFVVGKTGKLSDFEIIRPLSEDIDAEALRVAQTMPDWIPGKQGGKVVAVQFHLPIKFKLEDDKEEETTSQKVDNPIQAGKSKKLDIRDFKAFPNPASDRITVQFTTNEEIVEVKIIDANGQCFSTMNVMDLEKKGWDWKSEEIDVSEAARGMLLIQMQNEKGDKMRTEKVILQ